MSLISKILYVWHHLRRNYHQELLRSCLDHRLKAKFRNKLDYHTKKLDHLNSLKASV
jgi:hypothetical protein